ncbi:MAG: molybdopterin-binding protein [Ardenticatenaceae bacterium]|nr:molybdopterin-binding protein [Ardenticatenaceae bacterium]
MQLEERPVSEALRTILVRNVADTSGKKVIKKGTRLEERHLALLAELGHERVEVAVLEVDDVHEDEAAARLGEALKTDALRVTRAVGGRVNLHSEVDGLLLVDPERLRALNSLPGITLATRWPYTVVGPSQESAQVATLKIIPYAVARHDLETALDLAQRRPGILEVRPLPRAARAALLITAEPAAQEETRVDFETPTRERLSRLGVELATVETVPQEIDAIREAAARLAEQVDLLIVAGQTSIMDEEDITPRALRAAGATLELHGAPVEPGNLLALAYFPHTPVMCAPGCARSPSHNVVDMVLPRLLTGERLGRAEIAELGLGGLL